MAVTVPFKVKCESCELIFVINDLAFVGKQISCRRCQYRFQVPSPAPTPDNTPAPVANADSSQGSGFTPFKVKCALCELMFVVTDPAFIGKKIRCRQCQYLFRIENPGAADTGNIPAQKTASFIPITPPVEGVSGEVAVTTNLLEGSDTGTEITTPEEAASSDEVISDASVVTVGTKKKKKRPLKDRSKVTRLGIGIGALALVLIIGGYFAFSGNKKVVKPAPGIDKQTGSNDSKNPKTEVAKNQKITDTNDVKKGEEAGKADDRRPLDSLLADGRHITNLLPEDSQWVLSMTRAANDSPVFGVLFDGDGAGRVFKKWMGFEGKDVDELVMSGGLKSAWVFAVVRLAKPIAVTDLQQAMDLAPKQTILKHDYYRIRSNDLLKLMGEFIGEQIKAQGLDMPLVDPSETLALHRIDPRTLVIAHTSGMQKFLSVDTKRQELTRFMPQNLVDNRVDPKKAKDIPGKKGKSAPLAAKSGQPTKSSTGLMVDEDTRGLSTDPTYLSVDPALKIMLNQFDLEKRPMISFAVKFDNINRVGSGVLNFLSQQVKKIPQGAIPNLPVIGVRVQDFDARKLSLAAAIQWETTAQSKFWLESLNRQLPDLASFFTELIGVKITAKKPDAKDLGTGIKDTFQNSNAKLGSFLWTTTQERMITASLHVDWRVVYDSLINHSLRFQVDLMRGKALMSTGQAYWASNAPAIKDMEKGHPEIPQAAYPRKTDDNRFNLPYLPQERVSWMVDMLPYLGYESVFRRINKEIAWNDDANLRGGRTWIPEFLSPSFPPDTRQAIVPSMYWIDFGATHFTGLSGIGVDAAEYPDTPENAKKLGIFGYERRTPFADIVDGDGTSNTIFMIQTPPNIPRPWVRGGGSTVSSVPLKNSVKPFVSEQSGGRKGTIVLMADGSIRFLSETISDQVFQALVTYKGGEPAVDVEKLAPLEVPSKTERKLVGRPLVNFPDGGVAWQEVEIREIAGTIRMPSPPERIETSAQLTYTWPQEQAGSPLLTMSIFAPESRVESENGTEADLEKLLQEMAKKGLKPENKIPVTIGGRPGRQYDVSTSRGIMHQQMFIADSKVVIMEVAKNGRATPADVKKYFESVQLGGGGVIAKVPAKPKVEAPKSEQKMQEVLPLPRIKKKPS